MDRGDDDGTTKVPRRDFLGTGTKIAMVAGATGVLALAARARCSPRTDPVRMGIVGGNFGASFQFHEHPDCQVVAVTDLRDDRRGRLQQAYGCQRAFNSYEDMLAQFGDQLDAVGIFSEPDNHVPHAEMAAEYGLHVVSACPAALTIDECHRLRAAVERAGIHYMQAETSWYRPQAIFARERYKQGKFGEIHYVETEYYHDRGDLQQLMTNKKTRFWNPDGTPSWRQGYPPLLYPTHCTAYLTGVTGERVTHVSALGWGAEHPFLNDNRYDNRFWNEASMMQTSGGHMMRCNVFWLSPTQGVRAQWFGFDAAFTMASAWHGDLWKPRLSTPRRVELPAYHLADHLPEPMRHPSAHDNSHTLISFEFIDALMEGRSPEIDVYHSLAMAAPGIVGHLSALEGGKQLPVPQFDPA